MKSDTPQVPTTQKVQPEVKEVTQTPEQPPVVPQTPPIPTPSAKSKKRLKLIILIISLILVGLGIGGFYIYKNILQPETEKRETEEGIPSSSVETSSITKAGRLERDETWSGQINVTGDILVEEGITLTILPGTQIIISAGKDAQNLFGYGECDGIKEFDLLSGKKEEKTISCGIHRGEPYRDEANHISIIIRGTLKAIGTEDNRIVFKSDSLNPTIYDWNHLEIQNGILSYANIENYRVLGTRGDDVEISHNNLKNIGECGICANSKAKISFNTISYAGHELIDMHNSSPIIRNNIIGPNPDGSCITIDGGFPQITNNTFKNCGGGISLLVPASDTEFEDNVLRDNTFLDNSNDIWHAY